MCRHARKWAVRVCDTCILREVRSYQASFEAFQREGIDRGTAAKLMRDAVEIAACSEHAASAKILLSLSSFGASIVPASQEYTGNYPTPFGPDSETSRQALEDWHYERISVFAAEVVTWSEISYIAVETIPLLSEAEAVCAAVSRVRADVLQRDSSAPFPLWYVSFVFPDGRLPQAVSPSAIVCALASMPNRPDGIGINCTKMRFLPDIVTEMTQALSETSREPAYRPFLALYPDGGLVYDTASRTWSAPHDGVASDVVQKPAQVWADQLLQVVQTARTVAATDGKSPWSRLLLGGCCKAGPDYIEALSRTAWRTKHKCMIGA